MSSLRKTIEELASTAYRCTFRYSVYYNQNIISVKFGDKLKATFIYFPDEDHLFRMCIDSQTKLFMGDPSKELVYKAKNGVSIHSYATVELYKDGFAKYVFLKSNFVEERSGDITLESPEAVFGFFKDIVIALEEWSINYEGF